MKYFHQALRLSQTDRDTVYGILVLVTVLYKVLQKLFRECKFKFLGFSFNVLLLLLYKLPAELKSCREFRNLGYYPASFLISGLFY